MSSTTISRQTWFWLLLVGLAGSWVGLYFLNEYLWDWLFSLISFDSNNKLAVVLKFFGYETAKVLLLLVGMIFTIGLIRSRLSPEKVAKITNGEVPPMVYTTLVENMSKGCPFIVQVP